MPYAFYHWEYIDIFNYFSHQMTTIPPAVWTNAAHKHGVLSIGESLGGFSLWAKITVLRPVYVLTTAIKIMAQRKDIVGITFRTILFS